MKESLRNDPRYKSVRHEDREVLFNEYISELKAAEDGAEREAKIRREEQVYAFIFLILNVCTYAAVIYIFLLTADLHLSFLLSLTFIYQEKLKERERELRKRKEREEQEMERVRVKVRRKEAVASFQALLVETIKDPQVYSDNYNSILGGMRQGFFEEFYLF